MFQVGDLVRYEIPKTNYNSQLLSTKYKDRLGIVLESYVIYTTILWCEHLEGDNPDGTGFLRTNWLVKEN